ncbi:hypothetical protein BY996DRAFT_6558057 [Phakopsora pachyrhizi]|nr:hypothetical protein BY996DRAFT_6558057 [Phakopsora pachyrhizi]
MIELEMWVCELDATQGDGGADVVAVRSSNRTTVKQWRAIFQLQRADKIKGECNSN